MKSDTLLNWTSLKMCTGKLTSNLCSPSLCAQYFSVIHKKVSESPKGSIIEGDIRFHSSSFRHTQLLFERENIDYLVNKIFYFYYLKKSDRLTLATRYQVVRILETWESTDLRTISA